VSKYVCMYVCMYVLLLLLLLLYSTVLLYFIISDFKIFSISFINARNLCLSLEDVVACFKVSSYALTGGSGDKNMGNLSG
jgi:hypothetical protein